MMKTWRTDMEVSMGWVFTQLSSPDCSRSEVGFSKRQVPGSRQDFSSLPWQGACHLWQHQGLRKAWQTVPPTKDSSTIFWISCPILLTPNMSYREQRSSLSQKLSWALTPLTGCWGVGRQQESELLTMRLRLVSTGRALGARLRVNQSFQESQPQWGSVGSQMKSSQLTRCLACGHSHPSVVFSTYNERFDFSRRPQSLKIQRRWWLTRGLPKKPCPQQLFSSPKNRIEKGTPMISASLNLGGLVATALIFCMTSSMLSPVRGTSGLLASASLSKLPCRHILMVESASTSRLNACTDRMRWESVLPWVRPLMRLRYFLTAGLPTEVNPPPFLKQNMLPLPNWLLKRKQSLILLCSKKDTDPFNHPPTPDRPQKHYPPTETSHELRPLPTTSFYEFFIKSSFFKFCEKSSTNNQSVCRDMRGGRISGRS